MSTRRVDGNDRGVDGGGAVIPDAIRQRWSDVDRDPDLEADLGYEMLELEFIGTKNGRGQIIVLPKDEDLLRGDAFLVADEGDLYNVVDWS